MTLKEYFDKNHIDPVAFAVSVGIGVTSVYRYMKGGRPHLKTAVRISKHTKGKVTVKELRGTNAS